MRYKYCLCHEFITHKRQTEIVEACMTTEGTRLLTHSVTLIFALTHCIILTYVGQPSEVWDACAFRSPNLSSMSASKEIALALKYLLYDDESIRRSGIDRRLMKQNKNGKLGLTGRSV